MDIAPLNNSIYFGLIDSIGTFPTSESLSRTVPAAYTEAEDFMPQPNLSGYYSDPETTDLFTEVSNNLMKSAQILDNVMVNALENGFGVQDAVNINLAFRAYQANATVAKSTFELKI